MEKLKNVISNKANWLRIGQRVMDALKFVCVAFFITVGIVVASFAAIAYVWTFENSGCMDMPYR